MVLKGSERWYGVSVWKVIGKEWDFMKGRVCFSIANGTRVKL